VTFPEAENPLTRAYLIGAKARTHQQMRDALRLAATLEGQATDQLKAACKLAAEILLERKHENLA
jgi:uncharacterized protein (DUF1778 family)